MAKKSKKPVKKTAAKSTAIVVTQTPNPRNMLAVIARAASSKDVDVAKMQALLDMQRQVMADQAKIDFDSDFITMQERLPSISQTGKIIIKDKGTGRVIQETKYATYNEINRVTRPVLQNLGFALTFRTEPGPDGRLNVKGILKHRGGHEEETTFPLPLDTSGSKNNVQGAGSALSYGKRYSAIALLNLVSHAQEDRDLDGAQVQQGQTARVVVGDKETVIEGEVLSPTKADATPKDQSDVFPLDRTISGDRLKEISAAIADCGVTPAQFCEKYGIAKVEDLPDKLFSAAKQACDNFKNFRKK